MLEFPIYLDNNATTACDPRVVEEMMPYFSHRYGNAASRSHPFGWEASEAVEIARERVADLIGAESKEIIFTSGATESVNLALKGAFETYKSKGNHIITASTEHKAVLDTCRHLEKRGARVSYLPVDAEGRINLAELESAAGKDTILIAVMYANNEIGVIQPILEIGSLAKKLGILFLCDGAQAVGKIRVGVHTDDIDLLSISAHKIYGPKGVGALYVRRRDPRVKLEAQMDGGGHERGLRSGTLNVPGIVGLGKACQLCATEMQADAAHTAFLRDRLEKGLLKMEASYLNGCPDHRLPQTTNISFGYVDGSQLMAGINKDIGVSSGSACTSASVEPSYVLKALGLGDDLAHSSLRIGFGRFSQLEEVDFALDRITQTVSRLREHSLIWGMHKKGEHMDPEAWQHPSGLKHLEHKGF